MFERDAFPYLVADFGGTRARCAVVTGFSEDEGTYRLSKPRVYDCRQFTGIESALDAYLSTVDGPRPEHACIAIAGPVTDDEVSFTNLNWNFSISKLRGKMEFLHLEVMNDLAAVACATRRFPPDARRVLIPGRAIETAPSVVIGTGTGLGVAALLPINDAWHPVAGEGGHVALAPGDIDELEILALAQRESGHVAAEALLSGPGLTRLYGYLALIRGEAAPLTDPADITSSAASGADALCAATVAAFVRLLGGFCANVALTYGAWGGVYLAGDMLRHIEPELHAGGFAARFHGSHAMSERLRRVPVNLIDTDYPGLVGAAAWLDARTAARA